MNQSQTKAMLKPNSIKWLIPLIATIMMVVSLVLPKAAFAKDVYLGSWQDQSVVDYTNLYASTIFSHGSQGTASNLSLSLKEISETNLKSPHSGYGFGYERGDASAEATKTAVYLKTLFDYHYLDTIKQDGSSDTSAADAPLTAASTGLTFYNIGSTAVNFIYDSIQFVNVVNIFNLNVGSQESALVQKGTANPLVDVLRNMFNSMGIDESALKSVANIFFIFIVGIFAIVTMIGLRNVKQGTAFSKSKQWGLRLIVIVITLPLAIGATAIAGDIYNAVKSSTTNQITESSSKVIIDSLQFAGNTNLNLGAINPNGSLDSDSIHADKDFAPTDENVSKLNQKLSSMQSNSNGSSSDTDKINGFLSHEVVDVNAYFNWISAGGSNIAAASGATDTLTVHADTGALWQTSITGTMDKFYNIVNKGKADSDDDNESEDSYGFDSSKESKGNVNTITFTLPSGNTIDYRTSSSDVMNIQKLNWKDVSTYIYGGYAAKNTPPQAQLIYSYIWAGDAYQTNNSSNKLTDMVLDPVTGKQIKIEGITDDGDLKNYESDDTEKGESAIIANQIFRAGLNATIGSQSIGNIKSLTTQSVTFLLQTAYTYDGGGLTYKSGNLVGSEASNATNDGAKGVSFYRYVIPHDGAADLNAKTFKLCVEGLAAGVAALIGAITLITGPLLGSVFTMIKGFFKSLFLGDIFGLFDYLLYLIAIETSLMMFHIATTLGVWLIGAFTVVTDLVKGIQDGANYWAIPDKTDYGWDAAAATGAVLHNMFGGLIGGLLSAIVTIILLTLILLIFLWPITSLNVGGKQKDTNIISTVILLPFALATALSEKLNSYRAMFYGSAGKSSMMQKPKESGLAKIGKAAVGVGGLALGAAAVGGALGAGASAAKNAYRASEAGGIGGIGSALKAGTLAAGKHAGTALPNIAKNTVSQMSRQKGSDLAGMATSAINSMGAIKRSSDKKLGDMYNQSLERMKNSDPEDDANTENVINPEEQVMDDSIDGIGATGQKSDESLPNQGIENSDDGTEYTQRPDHNTSHVEGEEKEVAKEAIKKTEEKYPETVGEKLANTRAARFVASKARTLNNAYHRTSRKKEAYHEELDKLRVSNPEAFDAEGNITDKKLKHQAKVRAADARDAQLKKERTPIKKDKRGGIDFVSDKHRARYGGKSVKAMEEEKLKKAKAKRESQAKKAQRTSQPKSKPQPQPQPQPQEPKSNLIIVDADAQAKDFAKSLEEAKRQRKQNSPKQ